MGMNAVDAYKAAWKLYKANFKTYALSGLAVLLLTLVVTVPIAAVFVILFLIAMPAAAMNALLPPLIIGAYFIVMLLAVLAGGVFKGSLFGISYDLVQEEKIEWSRVFHWIKSRWHTFAGITLVQFLIALIITLPFMVAGFLLAGATKVPLLTPIITIIGMPIIILLVNILELAFAKTVAEFTGTLDSVGGAWRTFLASPVQFIILLVIGVLIGLLGVIPFVSHILVDPLNDTAFVLFYMAEKKPKRKK